ncbi:hydroxysqualene dehydroxylase [Paenibacillus mucilaginosus]|uniref:Phytoene dehydrogenase n=2 Tax=Paenibacillus mucilaginosus TaxID=61624 RepID=H6NR99_9BACL|nr:FAD-dependent oxidoreductase [Paenibacillus mucilaginosus]AEI45887.1 phytoene dehydrogenase [Paenibacillus mucilaginosus KNP414]AFC33534.1 phytoene dehydrogenase [Paenibacillus mucilaginosus 3016]MCG7217776.1 FAD-dependent oxidoreductase [Paenibacillus mucilaginosus]WDM27250.1 FAD-dependent oxidoreductase [Paenibacillus mucilaginosus]WFA21937.1 FAD-binding protein [Paenibacillus mucilaginosus]
MKTKVIILGGGVAGMSAAHELGERGYDVSVYEMKRLPGGKARSMPVPGSGKDGRSDLPGEHGFRFFPRFYKHIIDTMKRIPYGDGRHVADNLTEGTRLGLARTDGPPVEFLTEFPSSFSDLKDLFKSLFDNDLGLTEAEVEHYLSRIWQVMTSCDERREEEYQNTPWWSFINADEQSENFRRVFAGMTRILVAAKAREANTCTVGTVGAQIMLDMVLPGGSADRLLDGPTNEVWLHPWLTYLRHLGVDYHLNAKVEAISCTDGIITGATITEDGVTKEVHGDFYICALPVEVMAPLVTGEMLQADPTLAGIKLLSDDVEWMNGIQFYFKEDVPMIHGHMIYMDSPWALTSVSQAQFWPDFPMSQYGDGTVRGVLSVDVSDWEAPGLLYGKPAKNCTKEEIMEEVWHQLKLSLNAAGQEVLRDDNLHSWFLDEDIHMPNPAGSLVNLEPLLVNKVYTRELRPNAYTRIPNLLLASDYVRTNTDLATMEGANEAARRAVNVILERTESSAPFCKIWDMYDFDLLALQRHHDKKRFEKGLPWDGTIFSPVGS